MKPPDDRLTGELPLAVTRGGGSDMADPHLICAACERAEASVLGSFCEACKQQLVAAGLLEVDPSHQDRQLPRLQIGPTDI